MSVRTVKDGLGIERHLGGWKPPAPHKLLRAPRLASGGTIPKWVDLRSLAKVPIKDQGTVGSCTAHGSSSAAEFNLAKVGEPGVRLSRSWIYTETRLREGTPVTEDSGASVADAVAVVANGVPDESVYPYPSQVFSTPPPLATKHKSHLVFHLPTLLTIKASLSQGYAVPFGFSVPSLFMSEEVAQTGMVPYPAANETFEGGHCVCAFGFRDDMLISNQIGAVLCANSWGESWGISGFFWMSYLYFTNYLANDAWCLRSTDP